MLLLLACRASPDPSAETGDSADACVQIDCRDALTLEVLGVDGGPSEGFGGQLTDAEGLGIQFSCWTQDESFEGGYCRGEGRVELWTHSASYQADLYEGDDAPWFSGRLEPSWTAPYDSEECGHYCWLAEETVQLEPCEGCG